MAMIRSKKNAAPNAPPRKRTGLGRGLGALLPDIETIDNKSSEFFYCDIKLIEPNRYQPRIDFNPEELNALAQSIKEQGIIQPLIVRRRDTGYELIAGERRLRASKLAGLDTVPVIIKEINATELLELSIIENIQRQDLNPIEESRAYERLIDEFNLTQEQVAQRVGKSRSAITNFLRLLQLPDPIQTALREERLSMGHARTLLGIEPKIKQIELFELILQKGLSVRETEALAKKIKTETPSPKEKPPSTEEIYFADLAEKLSHRFGTKVLIKKRGEKGKVEIDFYSNEDLERLLDQLNPA